MRRLTTAIVIPLFATLFIVGAACKRQPREAPAEATDEQGQSLMTVLHVADPRASIQLLKGFHDIEQGAWRWTMRNFSVALRPPAGAAQNGAMLELKFSVPDPVIERLKSVTLSAKVGGTPLQSETYSKPGQHIYSREVPAAALVVDAVTVDFALDKAFPPSPADQRELGVVVTSVGFEIK